MENEVKKITEELTIREIMKIPEMKEYSAFLTYSPKRDVQEIEKTYYGDMKLSEISKRHPTWNGKAMAMGLDRILELEQQGKKIIHNIWSDDEIKKNSDKKNSLIFHFPGKEGKPFIIVCAGGAYMTVCSMAEAFPVAKRLNDLGYTAFVLNYRVAKAGITTEANEDLVQAIKFVLSNAENLKVSKENYGVAGFSAGGHLAATVGTDNYGYAKTGIPKPAVLFLGYPAVAFEYKMKDEVYTIMAGENYTQEELDKISIDKNMSNNYPATYIWTCKDDDTLPYRNSEIMGEKLKELGVPYIYKLFEHGGHGLGLGIETEAEGWLDEAVGFWKKQWTNI